MYDTLGDEAIVHICNEAELHAIVLAANKFELIHKLRAQLKTLKMIIVMDEEISDELKNEADADGLKILFLNQIEADGEKIEDFKPTPPKAEDVATICYTSGTTGRPKGALITHRSLVATISAARWLFGLNKLVPNPYPIGQFQCPGEVYLSYLPLPHILERAAFNTLVSLGFQLGFYQGDIAKLMDDLAELKPTAFATVPRLLNRIHDKVVAGVEGKSVLAQILFRHALSVKEHNYKTSGKLNHWLWDRIVFGAVREKLGGRCKVIVTGSAPLSPAVTQFIRMIMSCPVIEAYGLTETTALVTIGDPSDFQDKSLGTPSPAVEIKLVDVPDLGYTSADKPNPRGEIWVRGPAVFSGYYKNPEETAKSLKDGWLATGDIGMVDEKGRVYLIDRKKALFKLAQGEYISPEKIEAILTQNHLVAQAYVEGDSFQSYPVAVVVPDEETLMPWAKSKGIKGDFKTVCSSPQLKEQLLADFTALGHSGSALLKGFEIPRNIRIESTLFSVENDLITPTFKLKRPVAKKRYAEIVGKLYDDSK